MFEEDIQEAILLSKIDYEEKREVNKNDIQELSLQRKIKILQENIKPLSFKFYEAMRQETEEAKLAAKKKKKQAKKEKASSTMTLEEFNNLSPSQISNLDHVTGKTVLNCFGRYFIIDDVT